MAIELSQPIMLKSRGGSGFSVKSIDLHAQGKQKSSIVVVDDFRVRGRPFPPHPHAGFSAVTYVLEDSEAGLRSGDSLGNDIQVGPGGIVWTESGRGVIHHEVPAQSDRELHGIQFFVNVSREKKLTPPVVLSLDGRHVPEWHGEHGNRVRVLVGSYGSIASPLAPAEPFTLLDAQVRSPLWLHLQPPQNGLLYVLSGNPLLKSEEMSLSLASEQAVELRGEGTLLLVPSNPTRLLYFAGIAIHEPVVAAGPFIMNDASQISEAMKRYQNGDMGTMAPLSQG